MKKLWMLLVVLALLVTAVPMFASDVTFTGRMIWQAGFDPDASAYAGLVRFRPNLTAKIDDFNTLVAGFRNDVAFATGEAGMRVRDLYLTTDVTGALGLDLPFTVKTTLGKWEPGYTNWAYVSESGWENYYDWPNKLADFGPEEQGILGVDIGFGPAAFHVASNFLGFLMFGLSGGFGPVSGWVTYQAPATGGLGFGDGILGVEAKYAGEFGDVKVGVPVFFRYDLNDAAAQSYTWGVRVGGDYKMIHLAAGLEGDSDNALDNVVVDLSVAPVENLKVYGHLYMDLGEDYAYTGSNAVTTSFTGVDLGVSCKLGAPTIMLGWVVGNDDNNVLPINGDTFGVANGLYLAVDVSF